MLVDHEAIGFWVICPLVNSGRSKQGLVLPHPKLALVLSSATSIPFHHPSVFVSLLRFSLGTSFDARKMQDSLYTHRIPGIPIS